MINSLSPCSLQSERVSIREWKLADTRMQQTWPLYTDPLNILWNIPRPTSLYSSFLSIIHPFIGGGKYVWAVQNTDQKLIGRISLREVEHWRLRARLGISMAAPYVGRGFGTEALRLFLDYFFGSFGYVTMRLDVAAFNVRAIRCYENLGFRHIAHEWRNAGDVPGIDILDDPSYDTMASCFRREPNKTWVKFLEMELMKAEWLARVPECTDCSRSLDVQTFKQWAK